MITTILSFFGCNGQNKNNSKREFSKQTLSKIADENLLFEIYENIESKISKDYDKLNESFLKLSNGEKAIYIIWGLESEVNNGGFDQYYFNSSGQFAEFAPDALKLVGANKFSLLVNKANICEKQKKTSEDEVNEELEKFTNEFFELYKSENLHDKQVEYIKNNIEEFIDK